MKETMEQKIKKSNKEIHSTRDYHWNEYYKMNLIWNNIKDETSFDDLPNIDGSAMVVDKGYSLKNSLKYLKDYKGTILCCDRAASDVIKAGRVPEYITNVDSSYLCTPFYLNEHVGPHMKDMTAIFCTTSNPYIIDNYEGKKAFFIADGSDDLTRISMKDTGLPCFRVGGNILTASWLMASYMRANPICLVGCDNGYSDPKKKEHKTVKLLKRKIHGETRYTDEVYNFYTKIHLDWIEDAKNELSIETINCSKGVIHSRYTTPMRLKDFVKKYG